MVESDKKQRKKRGGRPELPIDDSNTPYAKLRRLRRERGWKVTPLANEIDIGPQYLSDVERGKKKPSQRVLHLLAPILHENPDNLIRLFYELFPSERITSFIRNMIPEPGRASMAVSVTKVTGEIDTRIISNRGNSATEAMLQKEALSHTTESMQFSWSTMQREQSILTRQQRKFVVTFLGDILQNDSLDVGIQISSRSHSRRTAFQPNGYMSLKSLDEQRQITAINHFRAALRSPATVQASVTVMRK